MLLVRDDAAIEQLDVAVHALSQCEVVGDRHHGLAVLLEQFAQHSRTPASLAWESSEPVGSSARMIGGSLASERATATLWRWPPESWSGRLCT